MEMINLLKDVAEAQASGATEWIKVAIELIATAGIVFGGTGYWQYKQAKLQAKKDAESKKENIDILNKQFKFLNDNFETLSSKFDGMADDVGMIKSDIVLLQEANKVTAEYRKTRDAQDKVYSEERSAVLKALRGTMRSRLLDFFERCIEKGYYTVEERDVYHPLYECYKSEPFNGNGVIDDLHNQLVDLPTTREEAYRNVIQPTAAKITKNARNRKTTHS